MSQQEEEAASPWMKVGGVETGACGVALTHLDVTPKPEGVESDALLPPCFPWREHSLELSVLGLYCFLLSGVLCA